MEPEGSLPHSQVPATCPYPELVQSSPYPHIPLPEDPPSSAPQLTNVATLYKKCKYIRHFCVRSGLPLNTFLCAIRSGTQYIFTKPLDEKNEYPKIFDENVVFICSAPFPDFIKETAQSSPYPHIPLPEDPF
jgi:hypothetical protein